MEASATLKDYYAILGVSKDLKMQHLKKLRKLFATKPKSTIQMYANYPMPMKGL